MDSVCLVVCDVDGENNSVEALFQIFRSLTLGELNVANAASSAEVLSDEWYENMLTFGELEVLERKWLWPV
jgi:hypothetical protein